MQLNLLIEEPPSPVEQELDAIATEVLGRYGSGLEIPDTMTPGELHGIWQELMARSDAVEEKYLPQLKELKERKELCQSKADKRDINAKIENLEGFGEFAKRICYGLFQSAYDGLNERLVKFATEHKLDADDFSERVNTLLSDQYYLEHTWEIPLSELMSETVKEMSETKL